MFLLLREKMQAKAGNPRDAAPDKTNETRRGKGGGPIFVQKEFSEAAGRETPVEINGCEQHFMRNTTPYPPPPPLNLQRWATEDLDEAISWCKTPPEPSMRFLLDHIAETVKPPYDASALSQPFAMAVNNIGRCLREKW